MDVETQLRRIVGSLSRESGVFGHVAAGNAAPVPDLVRVVAAEAEGAWTDLAVAGAVGPDTSEEIGQALFQVSTERAVDLLTYLATENLVFPGSARRDRAHVHRMAEKVVGLLGHGSDWYTNISELSPRIRAWEPVTRHTFDGVVAGTGNGFTVVLLQVGED